MPIPAGTGLTRASFVSRTAGLALAHLRRRRALGAGVRGGDRERRPRAGAERARRRLPHGRDRRALGALPGRRSEVLPAAPEHRDRAERRDCVQPGRPAALASDGRRPLDAARRGEGLGDPGDRLRQLRRVALHVASLLGGRRDRTRRCAPAGSGGYLDAVGTPDNPMQGLSLDTALQPALATKKMPVATLQAADQYTFAPPGLPPHPLEVSMLQEAANIGAAHANSSDPGLATAGSIALESHHLYSQLGSFKYGFNSPVAYPATTTRSRTGSPGSRRWSPPGCRCGWSTITRRASSTRMRRRRRRSRRGLQLTSDSLLAFQRDLEARGVADRVMMYVWSEFGRRAAENASAGTDHGSAGIGFLIGTKVNGQMIGGFPGVTGRAQQPRQPRADRRLPGGLLGDSRAVAQGRREPDPPERLGLPAADAAQVRLRRRVAATVLPVRRRPPADRSALQVTAKEFYYSLSRGRRRPGRP